MSEWSIRFRIIFMKVGSILTKKTSYFFIYFYSLLTTMVFGYLLKVKQLVLFVKPSMLLYVSMFLKSNTISAFMLYLIFPLLIFQRG